MNDLNAAPGGSNVSFADFERQVADLRQGITEGRLSPHIVEGGFEHLLRGHALRREFPIWKTVNFDLKRDRSTPIYLAYYKAIQSQGGRVSPSLHSIFFAFGFPPQEETEIDLVLITPREHLGFDGRIKRSRALERAVELGLQVCPPMTALPLRLAYTAEEQPCGEWIEIVTEPILEFLLRLGHPNRELGPYLDGVIWKTEASKFWLPDQKLVFRRPRSAL